MDVPTAFSPAYPLGGPDRRQPWESALQQNPSDAEWLGVASLGETSMTRIFVRAAAAMLVITLGGPAMAQQDRCGCHAQVQASMPACGSNQGCQQQVMASYYTCMFACYPQRGNTGTAR
jgi:hypothetical protein